MRLKNSRNGPVIPLTKATRKVSSILALDRLAKVILFRKNGRVRLIIASHVQVV